MEGNRSCQDMERQVWHKAFELRGTGFDDSQLVGAMLSAPAKWILGIFAGFIPIFRPATLVLPDMSRTVATPEGVPRVCKTMLSHMCRSQPNWGYGAPVNQDSTPYAYTLKTYQQTARGLDWNTT